MSVLMKVMMVKMIVRFNVEGHITPGQKTSHIIKI